MTPAAAGRGAMLLTAAIVSLISAVAAIDKLYAKIEQRLNRIARANNVSDDKIVIRELHTFVSDNGLRRQNDDDKPALRQGNPSPKRLKLKILDLMKQAIYGTQRQIEVLEPILQKHKDNPALRMNFILNRLDQLMVDIKRIYTISLRMRIKRRVYEQTIWYEHCARKFTDILYTVEYAISSHEKFLQKYGEDVDQTG